MTTLPKLKVFIRSRVKTFYNDMSQSVTSYNDKGIFDVLPLHANFITLIEKEIILDKGLETEQHFKIDKGLLCVFSDKIDIYLDV